ncbi:MAG: hypothetical protein ABL951_10155 [Alphaproteobacteria bacterium]
MKYFVSIVLALALASCASPVPPASMVPPASLRQELVLGSLLVQNVKLGDVSVAEGINGDKWDLTGKSLASNGMIINADNFRQALQSSMTDAKMLSPENGTEEYILDANLISVIRQEKPYKLFDVSASMESTSHYQLRRASDRSIVYESTLKAAFTANTSHLNGTYLITSIGSELTQIASLNAIRGNIFLVLRELSSITKVSHSTESPRNIGMARWRPV